MKKKLALAVLTASLYVAFPLVAQNSQTNNNGNHGTGGNHGDGNNGNHGDGNNGNHFGNNSNHSGHDDDGNSAGHRQDAPHGFGDRSLVLANHTDAAAVASAVTSVTASLKSGSMVTPAGSPLPPNVQTRTYDLLATAPAASVFAAEYSAALSTAGPQASAIVPSLVRGFSALKSDPAQLPSVVAQFNSFTKAASTAFISNPPPEFLAMHAVLGQLVTAAAGTKVSSTK
jgi:hypothetical protein